MATLRLLSAILHLSGWWSMVWGHGMMVKPASRNNAWRMGFGTPPQYTDNQLNCGGFATQWNVNGGKCGVCGDPWNAENTGEYVYPGKYATGVITATYTQGQDIEVTVQISANHRGYFTWRIGDIGVLPLTQESLKYTLLIVGGGTRWSIDTSPYSFSTTVSLRLPADLTCDHCVLQWWYHCGNNWGCSSPGVCGVGLNPQQETFVNCADVRILPKDGTPLITAMPLTSNPEVTTRLAPTSREATSSATQSLAPTSREITTTATKSLASTSRAVTTTATQNRGRICFAKGPAKGNSEMDQWCSDNCLGSSYCPTGLCECKESLTTPSSSHCRGAGQWARDIAMQTWCVTNCALGNCPTAFCDPACSSKTLVPSETRACVAVGAWSGSHVMTHWCKVNCAVGNCPTSHCSESCLVR